MERSEAPNCLLLLSHEILFKEKLKESLASELTATPIRPWQELAAFWRLPTTSEMRSSCSTKLLGDTPTGTGAEAPSACGPQEPDCIRAHLCSGWSSLNSSLKSLHSFLREVECTVPERAEPCLRLLQQPRSFLPGVVSNEHKQRCHRRAEAGKPDVPLSALRNPPVTGVGSPPAPQDPAAWEGPSRPTATVAFWCFGTVSPCPRQGGGTR